MPWIGTGYTGRKKEKLILCWSTLEWAEPRGLPFTSRPLTACCSPHCTKGMFSLLPLPSHVFPSHAPYVLSFSVLRRCLVSLFSPAVGKSQGSWFPFLEWKSKPRESYTGPDQGSPTSPGEGSGSLRGVRGLQRSQAWGSWAGSGSAGKFSDRV